MSTARPTAKSTGHLVYLLAIKEPSSRRIIASGLSTPAMQYGYAAYAAVCAKYGLMQLGCRAHVRRKFDEASKAQGKNLGKTKHSRPSGTCDHLETVPNGI